MTHLGDVGYDPSYGARPLKRAIQRLLENPIALDIVSGRVVDGQSLRVDVDGGQLVFQPT